MFGCSVGLDWMNHTVLPILVGLTKYRRLTVVLMAALTALGVVHAMPYYCEHEAFTRQRVSDFFVPARNVCCVATLATMAERVGRMSTRMMMMTMRRRRNTTICAPDVPLCCLSYPFR